MTALAAAFAWALAALAPAATTGEGNPDRAFRTPVMGQAAERSGAVAAQARGSVARQAKRLLRRLGGRTGGWAKDLETGRTIFAYGAARKIPMASVTKLFTTAAALGALGPQTTLSTRIEATAEPGNDGVLRGRIVLVGGGDPTLAASGIGSLAAAVARTGLRRVTGPLVFDDSIFDRRLRVPTRGVTGGPYLGSLSGLSISGGWGSGRPLADPALTAAKMLRAKLAAKGVEIAGGTRRPKQGESSGRVVLAERNSTSLERIAALTNKPSDNFIAEMLVKTIGAAGARKGATGTGMLAIRRFSSGLGAPFRGENGSGLSRRNVATANAIGRLLSQLEGRRGAVRKAFIGSLAVAGRDGTLAYRMRGSQAEGRCRGKTGTLNGVSALSGYCMRDSGAPVAFSILGDRVDTYAARLTQDRIVALLAAYAR